MLAAIIQKQQKLHTFPSNTTDVKKDLHLLQQQIAGIVQIVYFSKHRRKEKISSGFSVKHTLKNEGRECLCFLLCQSVGGQEII